MVWFSPVPRIDRWLAIGRFMEAALEQRADSALDSDKAWIAAARKLAA
jgi:hypothetical protein